MTQNKNKKKLTKMKQRRYDFRLFSKFVAEFKLKNIVVNIQAISLHISTKKIKFQ